MFLSFKVNGKKGTLNFLYFFLQTDKWSAKIMFARNAFVLFLHNTAFCKRKLHQITTELIFLWIIIISSNSSVATQKCEEAHFAPSGRYTMPNEKV